MEKVEREEGGRVKECRRLLKGRVALKGGGGRKRRLEESVE